MSVRILESKASLSDDELSAVEGELGVQLPLGYRQFLCQHNGGYPEPDVFRMHDGRRGMVDRFLGVHDGEHDSLVRYGKVYSARMPSDLIPVAHDAGGNLICVGVSGERKGRVFFWDHDEEAEEGEPPNYDNVHLVANSFDEFLAMLRTLEDA